MLNSAGVQNTYNHTVKNGNWYEDHELHGLRTKEYIHRKETGGLLVHQVQKHLDKSLTEVPLTESKDGLIRVGDSIMLYSVATEGVLSVDLSDRIASSDTAYTITTSTGTHAHVARNVFIVEGYGPGSREGDVLTLGQQFRLRVHPSMSASPLYLHSQPVGHSSSSKISRKQEVAACGVDTYDTVWSVQYKDHLRRLEIERKPVPANAEVVLIHGGTRQALSSAKQHVQPNDFGTEYEVCASTAVGTGMKQTLAAEASGTTTGDITAKGELRSNHWAFLTAAPADDKQ